MLLLITGCATQPGLEPVVPNQPIQIHNDIYVLPPEGDWYRRTDRSGPLMLALKPPPDDPTHTCFLAVGYWKELSDPDPGTPEALKDGVAKHLALSATGHFLNTKAYVSPPYRFRDTDCVRYELDQEERDNPNFPSETVLILNNHGIACRHPNSTEIVEAFFSERYKQGEQPLYNGTLQRETELFFSNITFTRSPT